MSAYVFTYVCGKIDKNLLRICTNVYVFTYVSDNKTACIFIWCTYMEKKIQSLLYMYVFMRHVNEYMIMYLSMYVRVVFYESVSSFVYFLYVLIGQCL